MPTQTQLASKRHEIGETNRFLSVSMRLIMPTGQLHPKYCIMHRPDHDPTLAQEQVHLMAIGEGSQWPIGHPCLVNLKGCSGYLRVNSFVYITCAEFRLACRLPTGLPNPNDS